MSTQKHSAKAKSKLKLNLVGDEEFVSFVDSLKAAAAHSSSIKTIKPSKIASKSKSTAHLNHSSNNVGRLWRERYTNEIILNQFDDAIETLSEISSELSNHATTRIAQLSAISAMGDRIDQINRENAEALNRLVNG